MAIYHFKIKTISRAVGQSAVAASAYRACARMTDHRTGQDCDYRRKSGHVAGGLVGWDGDAASLWNAAETAERRKDAKLAREIVLALPAELSSTGQVMLIEGFASDLRKMHGIAVQWDIHAPDRRGDNRNHHAHLLLTTRRVDGGKLLDKTRELDEKRTSGTHVEAWRAKWETRVNASLEQAGAATRIDRRSHARRHQDEGGIVPPPQPAAHLGPARTAIERRGRRTRAGVFNERKAVAAKLSGIVAKAVDALTTLAGKPFRPPSRPEWPKHMSPVRNQPRTKGNRELER